MRIKLKKGGQNSLISLAKENLTWEELAKKLQVSRGYLRNELRKEERLLSEEVYKKLCVIAQKNFDFEIIEKLDDNWGRSKGGTISNKRIKIINYPKKDENLSEIIGIILGDGHISEYIRGTKIRNYFIKIAGNSDTDIDYIKNYIPYLFEKVFNEKGKLFFSKKRNVGYFTVYGKNYVEIMKSLGMGSGNKKNNNQGIPNWIKKDKKLLKKCIRGLIDTDGSIHYISKKNTNLRISYTSYIPKLLTDVRDSLIKLGYNPSKVISNKQIYLSQKEEVIRYIKEIGFSNSKNLYRFNLLTNKIAPVV